MPKIIGAFAPKSLRELRTSCVRDVKADLISIGGVILFAICLFISIAAFIALVSGGLTSAQRAIVMILAFATWLYFLDSVTERLVLTNQEVHYKALFSRHRVIPLVELEAMILIQQGFNLEQGMQTIEFHQRGRGADRISLGPCWRRYRLEDFLHSVELALNDPHLLEELR